LAGLAANMESFDFPAALVQLEALIAAHPALQAS
jgi:hypothetical protein